MADESSRRSSRDASDRPKTNVAREAQSSNFDVVQAMVQEREKRSIVPGRFKEAAKEALRGIGEDMTYMLYKPILTRSERRNRAAEDELERIFEPAYTTLTGTDRFNTLGHGIGLVTVKRLVNKLGGDILISSKVGEGTTFHFTIAK